MRRRVLLVIATLALATVVVPAAEAKVPKGPAGTAFYTPPSKLPSKHGAAIWTRSYSGPAALKGGRNTLLLYRSTSLDGKATAVSGVLTVPKGKAPKKGWPIVSWAHGTTGIADQCAPSRGGDNGGYDHPLLQRWVKAGYAVVQTDYEGLGTPGDHPYLVGASEGRSVLDAVLAARAADPAIGKRFAISGHSQGGQAALFAAALAPKWTPSLKLVGTVAFAPVSHLSTQAQALSALGTTSLTGLAAMILRGVDIANPTLNLASILTPQAAALYPQTLTQCLADLDKPSSFGGLPANQLVQPGANIQPLVNALVADDDPDSLTIRTPLQIEQGTADTTVFPAFTDSLVGELKGGKPSYKKYDGLTHGSVVTSSAPQVDATAYLRSRLG
jgi:fermentation-respiration switch protein FrsA (DUF1100 family)